MCQLFNFQLTSQSFTWNTKIYRLYWSKKLCKLFLNQKKVLYGRPFIVIVITYFLILFQLFNFQLTSQNFTWNIEIYNLYWSKKTLQTILKQKKRPVWTPFLIVIVIIYFSNIVPAVQFSTDFSQFHVKHWESIVYIDHKNFADYF